MSEGVFAELLRRGSVTVVTLAEIDHPVGPINAWSGLGILEHDGVTYYGFGQLGSIEPVQTSTEIEVTEVRFALSGVDVDHLEGLSESVKGRFADVYEAFLDEHYRVAAKELLFRARLDYQTYSVDPNNGRADIQLVAHTGFFHLLNRSGAKMSPEEAKAVDPDETGYDEVYLQQDTQLTWKPS